MLANRLAPMLALFASKLAPTKSLPDSNLLAPRQNSASDLSFQK
ncbi:hypothetical protein ACLUTX_18305 [Enterobacterales bacterium AE_CKDN230030158-1A_HGKHYDSX7]